MCFLNFYFLCLKTHFTIANILQSSTLKEVSDGRKLDLAFHLGTKIRIIIFQK